MDSSSYMGHAHGAGHCFCHYPMYYPPPHAPHGPQRYSAHLMPPHTHYAPPPPPYCFPYRGRARPPWYGYGCGYNYNCSTPVMQRVASNRPRPRKKSAAAGSAESRGRGQDGAGSERTHSVGSADDDLSGDTSDDDDNDTRRSRSKYRTLLRELSVSEEFELGHPNGAQAPQTLRQAITMYIDFLLTQNERKVHVARFNRNPPMAADFETENYYHEAIAADVHFPSDMFKQWLGCFGVNIEVTDDPDATDPGQKIVVITNTPQRREPPALPAVAPPASQQSSVWPVTSGHSASDSGQQQQPPQQQQQPPQTVGMPAAAVGSGSAGEATLYVPIPSPSSGSASEVGEDGYQVITLVEDGRESQRLFKPVTARGSQPPAAASTATSAAAPRNKPACRKRKARSQDDFYHTSSGLYLPPREACVERRKKSKVHADLQRGSPSHRPMELVRQGQQFCSGAAEVAAAVQEACSTERDQSPLSCWSDVIAQPSPASDHGQHLLGVPQQPTTASTTYLNNSNNGVVTMPPAPGPEHQQMSVLPANTVGDANQIFAENIVNFFDNLNVSAHESSSQDSDLCSAFATATSTADTTFSSALFDHQRALHTPIFDDVTGTPFKSFTPQSQNGLAQLGDPVLVNAAVNEDTSHSDDVVVDTAMSLGDEIMQAATAAGVAPSPYTP